jgi:hypothetical protein
MAFGRVEKEGWTMESMGFIFTTNMVAAPSSWATYPVWLSLFLFIHGTVY